jgi:putative FmdB family regulatory protein
MPMFEYKCNNCGEKFELLVFGQENIINCPRCSSEKVQKLMSAFASQGATATSGNSCGGSGKFT